MNKREHLLTIVQEECAEIIQQISKIKRFGLLNTQPASGKMNFELLHDEVNDLFGVLDMLVDDGIPILFDEDKVLAKKDKVERFLEISREAGTLK